MVSVSSAKRRAHLRQIFVIAQSGSSRKPAGSVKETAQLVEQARRGPCLLEHFTQVKHLAESSAKKSDDMNTDTFGWECDAIRDGHRRRTCR